MLESPQKAFSPDGSMIVAACRRLRAKFAVGPFTAHIVQSTSMSLHWPFHTSMDQGGTV